MGISVTDILGGSLLESVKGIISQFHMSPEEKAELSAKLEAQKEAFAQAENDYNVKLNDIAGQNIRAEQQSGDKFVTRARPAWIWAGLGIIAWNYCLMPVIAIIVAHWKIQAGPVALPDAFWWTVGTVTTGYVFNRTAQEIMQMPGESSIKLPFGIQVGQNSAK